MVQLILHVIIRVLLAGIFVYGGWGAMTKPGSRPQKVAAAHIPFARLAVIVNGGLMVVAGLLLAVGIVPRVAAAVLVASMIPTTLVGHPFWHETSGPARDQQAIHFLKNLGLIGGLLLIAVATV